MAPPEKPKKSNGSQENNKNPITEAWAEAWKKQTNGKTYPWAGSYHRAVKMAKDVDPQPHALLVEDMSRYLRSAKDPSIEGWIRGTVQAQRRAALGRPATDPHETVDDLLGLLPKVEFTAPTPPPPPPPKPSGPSELELARAAHLARVFGGAR